MELGDLIKLKVQKAAKEQGIGGVLALAKHCDLSYERTVRVWKGDNSAKIADVIRVLNSVNLKLEITEVK